MSTPKNEIPETNRAYLALLSVSTRLQQHVDQDLRRRVGLTHAQFEILAALSSDEEGRRMAELADHLMLSRSGLTYQMSQLEKAGYVSRRRDAEDDRGVFASLTEAGRGVLGEALPEHVALVHRLAFDGMDSTDVTRLADILERMDGRLDRSNG